MVSFSLQLTPSNWCFYLSPSGVSFLTSVSPWVGGDPQGSSSPTFWPFIHWDTVVLHTDGTSSQVPAIPSNFPSWIHSKLLPPLLLWCTQITSAPHISCAEILNDDVSISKDCWTRMNMFRGACAGRDWKGGSGQRSMHLRLQRWQDRHMEEKGLCWMFLPMHPAQLVLCLPPACWGKVRLGMLMQVTSGASCPTTGLWCSAVTPNCHLH